MTSQSKNSAPLSRTARVLAKRILRRQRPVRWGNLRRRRPFSSDWGFDRGQPVDRHYIEEFLSARRDDIRGAVLEVGDPEYTRLLGGSSVTSSDVVDMSQSDAATIVADLAAPGSLPPRRFDCVIVTQTLQYVADPAAAVANLWGALAEGGTLLLTVPCLQRIDPDLPGVDRWRFTPLGLEQLIGRGCPDGNAEVVGYGNVLVCVAFLMGLAADELRAAELEERDPDFPLIACARVRKPSA